VSTRTAPTNKDAGERHAGAARWPAVLAIAVAVAVYALLPSNLIFAPRVLLPVVAAVLLVPILVIDTRRMTRRDRTARVLAVTLIALLAAVNTASLLSVIAALVDGSAKQGTDLLLGAFQIWLVNGIVFGLIYWEIDRGGPIVRATAKRAELPPADFRFSQDENDDAIVEVAASSSKITDWRPNLVDYLYVACTNSTAFSPTDTMPLKSRTKALMALQSIESLLLSLLVVARGVSLIK
jgi:hypothetical protein